MNKFSIKIDLSTFFEDERKMVLLMVDPETWTQVKCLQKRVQTLFDVDECRFVNDGCFIPPEEPIEILRFCKELTAFVPKESLDKRKRKKSKQVRASDDCQNDIVANAATDGIEVTEDETKKKRKYRSLGNSDFISSTPHNNKRVKNCVEGNAATTIKQQDSRINKSSEISSTSSEQMPPPHPTSLSKDKKRKASKKEASSDSTDDVSTENSTSASSSKVKKRISSMKKVSGDDLSAHNSNSPSKDQKRKTSMKEISSDSTDDLSENTIVVSQKNSLAADHVSRKPKGMKSSVGNEHYCVKNDPSTEQISEKSKQKLSKSLEDNSIEISKPTARISTLPSSTFINESAKSQKKSKKSNNPFRNQSTNLQHIHFNESGEISTTTTNNIQNKENEKPIPKVIYQCVLNEVDAKKPRIFQITSRGGDNKDMTSDNGKKPLIEIRENILITPIIEVNKSLDLETAHKETSNDGADTSSADFNRPDNTTKEEDQSIEDNSLTDEINNSHTMIVTCTEKTMDGSVLKNIETDNNCTTTITDKKITDQSETEISVNLTTKENESTILSVDSHLECVDLSMDVDEENDIKNKSYKLCKSKASKNVQDISISDTSDVEEVIDLNETDDQNTTTSSSLTQGSRSSTNAVKVNRIISWCKEAKEVPDIGDIIIFKIPFTNRKGNPDCTKFLAGKIERIQQRTKSIKLHILDGHTELFYVPDKYLDKYNDNSLCEEKYVQIKFSEIIQPRILPKDKMSLL